MGKKFTKIFRKVSELTAKETLPGINSSSMTLKGIEKRL